MLPILLGIGGALAAGYVANSGALKKAVKEDKTRAALIGGLGVVGALMLPKAAPLFAGVAIAGGTTLVQLMTAKNAELAASSGSGKIKGIGEVSEAQIEELRNRVRAAKSRMNGIPRGVMTGIPSGMIVGVFDDDMPRSRFA